MPKFIGTLAQYSARASVAWYLGLIALGTFALLHPACRAPGGQESSLLDAAFTSTSAVCVTGLVVRSTGNDFSLLGQIVILGLIQLGGIGIMTVTTYVTFVWGRRQSLRDRALLSETVGADPVGTGDLRSTLGRVMLMTFLFEAAGFLLLFCRNLVDKPAGTAAWNALFHAVSAFCNAGFSLFDDSLMRYQNDPLVSLTICGLIIGGGLGFPVMLDLHRSWRRPRDEFWHGLHLHSKLMLIGTASLIVMGTLTFLLLEWDKTLAEAPLGERLLSAFFQSVTARTAGFNTVDVGLLTNATLFVLILLMMIGAGPCSTGGGFKVSTLMALLARAWATARGVRRINLFRRTVPEETTNQAIVTALLFAVVSVAGLAALLVLEQSSIPHPESQGLFLDAVFEVVSALATVGLSTGMTTHLTDGGRLIIIALMFVGRLGPISVVVALARTEQSEPVEMPSEEPLIG